MIVVSMEWQSVSALWLSCDFVYPWAYGGKLKKCVVPIKDYGGNDQTKAKDGDENPRPPGQAYSYV